MSCCGQRRTSASRTRTLANGVPVRPEPPREPARPATPRVAPTVSVPSRAAAPTRAGSPSRLRYTGVAEIAVRGPHSGRAYVFSSRAPERLVEGRDVDGLMRMGLFRRSS